jgi:hypothetical protein
MAEVDTEWCRGLSTEGRLGLGGTLASQGSRADPHYHIVTTFEAKESGAPGVLAQSLGISGRRCGWLLSFVFTCVSSFLSNAKPDGTLT